MRVKYNQYRHKVDEPMIRQYWLIKPDLDLILYPIIIIMLNR